MSQSYHILAKKAIGPLLLFTSLFWGTGEALARLPNDPSYNQQETMWKQLNAPTAWDYGVGSSRVSVAVIDAGVDIWHSDLDKNIWTNPYEIPDNGVDDDGNGYVDDTHGWNFVEENNDIRTSVFDNKDDPEAVRHGTVIAGLIGAMGNNNRGGVGVNWRVKIMPLRAIDSSGAGSYLAVAKAVDYAVDNGANVISMSFVGDSAVPILKESLLRAYQKGVVVVAAAGNHSRAVSGDLDVKPNFPACIDKEDSFNWVLSVGSVDERDRLSRFSNYGNCVDIVAPGEGIFSTERYAPQFGYQNDFGGPWRGTSFAAPLVAGTAALIKSFHPEWGPDKIITTILKNADNTDDANPAFVGELGGGRLNIGRAILAATAEPSNLVDNSSLYYFQGDKIGYLNFKTGRFEALTALDGAKILSLSSRNLTGSNRKVLVALIKRNNFYYVRLLKDKGEFWREFSLSPPKNGNFVMKKIEMLRGDPQRFLVESFDAKKKITLISEYNLAVELARSISIKGIVARWSVGEESDRVVIATRDAKKINLKQIGWDSDESYSWSLPGTATLDDIRLARVWDSEEAVILIHRAKEVRQIIVDLPSGASENKVLTRNGAAPWRLALLESGALEGGDDILPFSSQGGVFAISTGRGAEVRRVKISSFPSATK